MKKICISKDWKFRNSYKNITEKVDLPHDYSIQIPRNPQSRGGASNGFYEGTYGEYSKYITFPKGEHTILDIDGAYMCARIRINDNILDMHPYGYTPYLVDLSDKVRKDRINKIAISTVNMQPSSRWYSGAGVYRDVFVWTGGKVRIEPWDLFVTTKEIAGDNATISVEADISSDIYAHATIKIEMLDKEGSVVLEKSSDITEKAGKNRFKDELVIEKPNLWGTENPYLYTLKCEIIVQGKTEDTHEVKFGIRTISVSVEEGFKLNGKSMKLRGGCIHHDHGALGSSAYKEAEYRKVFKLKNAGFNAIRTAHNPPSLALLQACDELGIIIMDEAFDMWNQAKSSADYSLWFRDWWARDISYMVLRDRNHPSVASYSIGNEISERNGNSEGAMWSKMLYDEVRKYDVTRPVTSGICGLWEACDPNAPEEYKKDFMKGFGDIGEEGRLETSWAKRTEDYIKPLDMTGYNYMYFRYAEDKKLYPNRIIWGSETKAIEFYKSWNATLENSHVLGDFTWTAYDNLGEAGTGRALWKRDGEIKGISLAKYPWRNCYQGDLDLCGFRRPQSYFREAVWIGGCEPRIFTTHPEHYGEKFTGTGWHWYDVNESWSFDDKYIGKLVKADVYTDADEIHFELNGEFVGKASPIEGIASVDVPYEKGTLTATSYKDGKLVGKSSLTTIGKGLNVKIEEEAPVIRNQELHYFDITITDDEGNRVPFAENEIKCTTDGGELLCAFSGNPANEDVWVDGTCHAFYGRALAIVKAKIGENINLKVELA